MTAPLDSNRCWAVDEESGQQCQKRILTGMEIHPGPCAFVLDDIWLGVTGGHFRANDLLTKGWAQTHRAHECPGPPECWGDRQAFDRRCVMLILDELPEDIQELHGEKGAWKRMDIELARGRVIGAAYEWRASLDDAYTAERRPRAQHELEVALDELTAAMIPGGWNGPRRKES